MIIIAFIALMLIGFVITGYVLLGTYIVSVSKTTPWLVLDILLLVAIYCVIGYYWYWLLGMVDLTITV